MGGKDQGQVWSLLGNPHYHYKGSKNNPDLHCQGNHPSYIWWEVEEEKLPPGHSSTLALLGNLTSPLWVTWTTPSSEWDDWLRFSLFSSQEVSRAIGFLGFRAFVGLEAEAACRQLFSLSFVVSLNGEVGGSAHPGREPWLTIPEQAEGPLDLGG